MKVGIGTYSFYSINKYFISIQEMRIRQGNGKSCKQEKVIARWVPMKHLWLHQIKFIVAVQTHHSCWFDHGGKIKFTTHKTHDSQSTITLHSSWCSYLSLYEDIQGEGFPRTCSKLRQFFIPNTKLY